MNEQFQPAVWYSDFVAKTANYGQMECIERPEKKGTGTAISERRTRFEQDEVPLGLRDLSGKEGEKYARFMPDFFTTGTALLTVSEKMHDLLVQFDMGDNQLIELPFFAFDGVTPRPERFWILAVATWKAGIDEEKSSIGPPGEIIDGKYKHLPNELEYSSRFDRYRFNGIAAEAGTGQLAMPKSVAQGADLWSDPRIIDLLFFSDRLRRAIKDTKLRIKDMPFYQAVLTDANTQPKAPAPTSRSSTAGTSPPQRPFTTGHTP